LVSRRGGGSVISTGRDLLQLDVLVVGAGFAGSVLAERFAAAGREVLVIDKREHIGGNAFDEYDAHGVLIHRYGPHLFHTNSKAVFDYLSRFTEWRPYEHRVQTSVDGQLLPIPINQDTINRLYGLNLDEAGVAAFLEGVRESRSPVRTSEDVVLNSVGRELCDKFFRNYTRKQWGLDLSELSATVLSRIPVRTNRDDRYFSDTFQAMPLAGYTAMFGNILDHARIRVELGTDFAEFRKRARARLTVYTGPIDEYFGCRFGKLPYRSLRFEHTHLAGVEFCQPVCVLNFPNEQEYTRSTEYKHATGQKHSGTSITREYPTDEGDPYYPVPRAENQALYKQYEAAAEEEHDTVFVGRLAQYRYYNMDQAVAAALRVAQERT
jgi:UDP-galactopyranose mutase